MREKGKKQDGQRNVLPPQIFNGEELRGNFEDFDIANEDDNLEEFLGVPRKNPKAAPVKTGAVAPEVGRLKPGKLDIKDKRSEVSSSFIMFKARHRYSFDFRLRRTKANRKEMT